MPNHEMFIVGKLRFSWDRAKAASNLLKYKVSFEEGASIFIDESATLLSDPDQYEDEVRFVLIGYSVKRRLLAVVHVERGSGIHSSAFDSHPGRKGKHMKKKGKAEDGEMRAEYDFSKGRPNPYAARAKMGTNLVLIEPDLYELFPSSNAVNDARRLIVRASARAMKSKAVKQARAS